jgi:hypothetical protein
MFHNPTIFLIQGFRRESSIFIRDAENWKPHDISGPNIFPTEKEHPERSPCRYARLCIGLPHRCARSDLVARGTTSPQRRVLGVRHARVHRLHLNVTQR